MIRVIVILVTFNRFDLLKQALNAITNQSFPVEEVVVVNNGSTDETGAWLNGQKKLTVINQVNSGGSGGFYSGIKYAARKKCDWIWIMDDDTICTPTSLEILLSKLTLIDQPIGFLGSKCIWIDGNPHLMNIPAVTPVFNKKIPFNKYDEFSTILVENNSFVSLLLNTKVVAELGLPYKEFFIWGDDQEYTRRITQAGYLGLYCSDSVVLHKTPANYFPDFYNDVPSNLWKHAYGFRNEFFMIRKNKGSLFFSGWLILKVGHTIMKLLHKRKDNRLKFIAVLFTSAWKSIFFYPKIDRI